MGFLGFTGIDFMDRRNDAVMRAAAAQIAAHALAQFVMAERETVRRKIAGDVARHTGACFGDHRNRRANLAGRTVAALEAVMLDKRLLERMEVGSRADPLDGGDLLVGIL